jgi:hypothetical protein
LTRSATRPGISQCSRPPWSSAKSDAWRTSRKRLAALRASALWHEAWLRRLAEQYSTPFTTLERMTMGELAHEIALLWADAVIYHAKRLTAREGATIEERAALMRERIAIKQSKDWFDGLVVERMAIEHEQQKTNKKE